jgi:hypothetical protein
MQYGMGVGEFTGYMRQHRGSSNADIGRAETATAHSIVASLGHDAPASASDRDPSTRIGPEEEE